MSADATALNRAAWNRITPVHNAHKADQAGFLRRGGSTLFPEELELLGPLDGRDVLHLQCNCGQDTLSLVHHGARVTGVDLSDAAIDFARQLSTDSGLPATFEQGEVLDWLARAALRDTRYDLVFASYGVLGWIEDLPAWMRGAAAVLRPGGRLVVLEFHPLIWSLGPHGLTGDPYFLPGPIVEAKGVNDYVGGSGTALTPMGAVAAPPDDGPPTPCVSWQHTTADLLDATVSAGLHLHTVREWPYANGFRLWPTQPDLGGGRWGVPDGVPSIPMMLGWSARKPEPAR